MTEIRRLAFVVFTVCLLASCSDYQKVLKDPNYEAKEKLAKELYDKKKWARALPLYEELITIYRGTRKAEDLYYYYAYCNYGVGDYLLANYWFEYFVNTYPFSPKAEECEYMAAYCFYRDSPREPLEQTNTVKAIRELQSFIDAHPQSARVPEANTLIDKLRKKLENKDYRIGIQYLNMEYYTASIVSFQNLLKDYPETDRRPEVSYLMVKAAYQYASQSVKSRKKERLVTAKELFDKYVSRLPDSKYKKDGAALSEKINRDLATIEAEEAALRKVQQQIYESGVAQYNAKNYHDALSTFQHLLKEFPKPDKMMEISFYMIKGSYELAEATPGAKKKGKLIDAKNNYTKFAGNLRGTLYEKETKMILTAIEEELAVLDRKK